jgi:hypothetical protein
MERIMQIQKKWKNSVVLGLAAAMGLGLAGYSMAEGPGARAQRQRREAEAAEDARLQAEREAQVRRWKEEDAAREREQDKKNHPEIWNAIRQLRAARNNLYESRNEKAKLREPAIKAINDALAVLEGILARD